MKSPLLLLCCTLPLMSVQAAETRYVSDDLYTYLHAGPGKEFKILGSVTAGEPVQFQGLGPKGKYAQIVDGKGRTAWLPLAELQQEESLAVKLPRLESQLVTLKASETDKLQRLTAREREVDELKAQLQKLRQQQERLMQENHALTAQRDTQAQDEQLRWLRNGGLLAGAAVLLGFLLAHLPRPRRRKRDSWA